MTFERKPFEVQTDYPYPLRMGYIPEADTDMWWVERDYNYLTTLVRTGATTTLDFLEMSNEFKL